MPLSTTQYGFIIDPMVPFTDASGTTIRNGYVRVFVAGSSTPVITYKNYDGATNEETIQLDNSGRTAYPVIVSKGNTYKVCVYDAEHSQESPILTIDKVVPAGANVEATNIVTGLDNVESPEAGWVKSTVSGTDAEVSLDATNVTSEVDTMVKATAASADYMMPLVHKTGSDPDKKITLGNIFKFVLNFIHSLTDTATESDIASGNYFALDGSAGTKKLNSTTLLTKTAQNALAENAIPANFQSSLSYADEVQGYYNVSGTLTSSDNPRYLARKYIVGGDTGFTIRANMFGYMAVCEFDEDDNFIKSHRIGSDPYDRIDFITDASCSYLWVSTDINVSSYTGVFANDEMQLKKNLEVLNYAFVADDVLGSENGYYDSSAIFVPSTSNLTLEYSVETSTQYVWVGDIYGSMNAVELASDGSVIALHPNTNNSKTISITTSETTSSLKVTSRITGDFRKPWLLKLAKNETSEKVTRPTLVDEGVGFYPEGGVVNVNDDFMYKKYSVNGSRYLKAVGYFFGTMRVCEFDKDGVFICSHRKNGNYTSIEFVTRHECAYVGIATRLKQGIAADLFDLGANKAPFPRIMYGVEGVQKNIYNDRFGVQPYGNVYIVPNPSEDNTNYTRFHNRLEFNVASHSDFSIDVWPSVSGKSLFGDDITPSSSVAVKIKEKANPATAKNILWVGDSISDYQNTAKYAKEIFDGIGSGVAPTFVGTRHTAGTPDESYAGRNTYWLLRDNGSPFRYNNAVDFAHYNSVVGVSKIDLCVMAMGFNDASRLTISYTNTLAEYKNLYKEFIEKITTANPGIKIVWVLCPFGSKYEKMRNANAHSEGAVMLRNLVLELSYEYSNVVVSDAFYCIDSVNGYPLTEAPIASVYSSLDRTQEFCSDSTHPTALGCKEWGQNVVGAIIEAFGL